MPDMPTDRAQGPSSEEARGMNDCIWCGDPVPMKGQKCTPCAAMAVKAWKGKQHGK